MNNRPQHVTYGIVTIDQTKGHPQLFVGSLMVRSWPHDKDTAEAIKMAEELSGAIEQEKQSIKVEMEDQFRSAALQIKTALGVYGLDDPALAPNNRRS